MLKQRIITAVALILAFGAVTIYLSPFIYTLLISAVILCAGWEWSRLSGLRTTGARLAYLLLLVATGALMCAVLGIVPGAAVPRQDETVIVLGAALLFWLLVFLILRGFPDNRGRWDGNVRIGAMGMLALLPGLAGVAYLKYLSPAGYLVLAMIVLVAAVDIGAYFAGRGFGRRRLAPKISPNKSWEGVWGGLSVCLAAAAVMAWAMHRWLQPLRGGDVLLIAALALVTTGFCVIGDLLESMLKRNRDTKDSGSLLPGHGGLLDRIDGLLAAAPAFVLGMMLLLDETVIP